MMNDDLDDRLDLAARAYAEQLPALPPALDDAIMAAVRRRAGAGRPARRRMPNVWRWLVEPQPVRVRPALGLGLAAAAALALYVIPGTRNPEPAVVVAAAPVSDTVFVRFELAAPSARAVALAGSFNDWQDNRINLARSDAGVWSVTVALPVGEHRYQFVVDGSQWVIDPRAHAQIADGFGGTNSVIVVGPKGVVRS